MNTSCVGHATQLEAICQSSLDSLVDQLAAKIATFSLPELRFKDGVAHLVDDNQDGIGDRIENGTWDVETNFGLGADATFTATTAR